MASTIDKRPIHATEIDPSRLVRLGDDQFHRAIEAGILPHGEGVGLFDGLLRTKGSDGPLYRLELDQYHRLVERGILREQDRAELLGGWIVAKMSIKPPHQTCIRKARWELARVTPVGWFVDQNAPISMPSSDSELEPDVVVVRGEFSDYADRHPGPADVSILVEVADSSLTEDRGYQKWLYAAESIPVYWSVNCIDLQIEVYTEPSGPSSAPDYRLRRDYKPGELIPVVIDGHQFGVIAAVDLMP
jgi:Uma2 family endonuclease